VIFDLQKMQFFYSKPFISPKANTGFSYSHL